MSSVSINKTHFTNIEYYKLFTCTDPYRLGNSNLLAIRGGVERYSVQENTRIKVFIFIMEQLQKPKVSEDFESKVGVFFFLRHHGNQRYPPHLRLVAMFLEIRAE